MMISGSLSSFFGIGVGSGVGVGIGAAGGGAVFLPPGLRVRRDRA